MPSFSSDWNRKWAGVWAHTDGGHPLLIPTAGQRKCSHRTHQLSSEPVTPTHRAVGPHEGFSIRTAIRAAAPWTRGMEKSFLKPQATLRPPHTSPRWGLQLLKSHLAAQIPVSFKDQNGKLMTTLIRTCSMCWSGSSTACSFQSSAHSTRLHVGNPKSAAFG